MSMNIFIEYTVKIESEQLIFFLVVSFKLLQHEFLENSQNSQQIQLGLVISKCHLMQLMKEILQELIFLMNNSFNQQPLGYPTYGQPHYGHHQPQYIWTSQQQPMQNTSHITQYPLIHTPNLINIQYYAAIELEVNLDDRRLRVDEIIEIAMVLVQDGDILSKKRWYVKPTVFPEVFAQTVTRTGITIEMLRDKLTLEGVLNEIDAQINRLPLLPDKSDLLFVSSYEDTFTIYLRGETDFKDIALKPYLKNFIALENNFPAGAIPKTPLTHSRMLEGLNLRPHEGKTTCLELAFETANILRTLIERGSHFTRYQQMHECQQQSQARFVRNPAPQKQRETTHSMINFKFAQETPPIVEQKPKEQQRLPPSANKEQSDSETKAKYQFDVTTLREQNHQKKEQETTMRREDKYKRFDSQVEQRSQATKQQPTSDKYKNQQAENSFQSNNRRESNNRRDDGNKRQQTQQQEDFYNKTKEEYRSQGIYRNDQEYRPRQYREDVRDKSERSNSMQASHNASMRQRPVQESRIDRNEHFAAKNEQRPTLDQVQGRPKQDPQWNECEKLQTSKKIIRKFEEKGYDNDWVKHSNVLKNFNVPEDIDYLVILHLETNQRCPGIREAGILLYDVRANKFSNEPDVINGLDNTEVASNLTLQTDTFVGKVMSLLDSLKVPIERCLIATTCYAQALRKLSQNFWQQTHHQLPDVFNNCILIMELYYNQMNKQRDFKPSIGEFCKEINLKGTWEDREKFGGKLLTTAKIIYHLTKMFDFKWGTKLINFRLHDHSFYGDHHPKRVFYVEKQPDQSRSDVESNAEAKAGVEESKQNNASDRQFGV